MSTLVENQALRLDHKDLRSPEMYCVCCLAKNISYVPLEKCKYKHFLLDFLQVKLEFDIREKVICIYCHRFIQKIEKFKEIVLNNVYSKGIKTSPQTLSCLKRTALCIVTVLPAASKQKSNEPRTINENVSGPFQEASETGVKSKDVSSGRENALTDIKIEQCSDEEIMTNQVEIKLEPVEKGQVSWNEAENELIDYVKDPESTTVLVKVRRSSKSENVKEKLPTKEKFYQGKVKFISMNLEQVMAEREATKKSPAYLDKEFHCEKCVKGFSNKWSMEKHMEKHDKKFGSFMCSICSSYYNTDASMKEHYRCHFMRYECMICKQRFMSDMACGSHYNQAHGKEYGPLPFRYSCNECDFVIDTYVGLRKHREKTHNTSFHECQECYKRFPTSYRLEFHVRNMHSKEKQVFNCELCGKGLRSKYYLKMHISRQHSSKGSEADRYCADCDMVFANPFSLMQHLKQHSRHVKKQLRFTCDHCGDMFAGKADIIRHIHCKHMPPSKCPMCSKELSSLRTLRRHIRTVHEGKREPKNKMCTYCGKGFTTNTILKTHIRTHTLERPLQCPHCPATFAHGASRYTHIKLLHNPDRVRKRKPRQTRKKQSDDD